MASASSFEQYVEALNALAAVDGLQRDALRKAVASSNAAASDAKAKIADQQRMYDRTGREIQEAQRGLDALRVKLGAPRASAAATPQAGAPPTLVELRSDIAAVSQWLTETEPVAESLLRSKARLSKAATEPAPKPTPPPPAPTPVPQPEPKRRSRLPVILGGVGVAVVVIIVVISVIAMHH